MPISTHATPATSVDLDQIREQVLTGAAAASSRMATDVVILEVGPLVGITDFFLLISAANDRQLKAAVEAIEERLRTEHGRKPMGREGTPDAGWMVLDFGDFVVHAFTTTQRQVYDLERLWGDASRVPYTDPQIEARSMGSDGHH
ncbi:MAG: ribosome silencing factor [Euzebya sp.]